MKTIARFTSAWHSKVNDLREYAGQPSIFWLPLLALIFLYMINLGEGQFTEQARIVTGWSALMVLFILHRSKLFKRMPLRGIFILLSAFLALRYLWWRTFETLIYNGMTDFIGMILLYCAELYGITVYLLGMFVNLWPLDTKLAPLPENSDDWPTVDIFVPTYNEPEDIVLTTVTAAMQIDYPRDKLNVYILDDGGTVSKRNHPVTGHSAWERRYRLKKIAQDAGVHYITREINRSAKAGNLNHALQHTHGELVLVLDCDHVPTKDILLNTVGHFVIDPKLALVQTPHFFINPGPPDKALAGSGSSTDESEMFYRVIHPGLDSWNASYFCGSAAILRRKYLEKVGGIAGNTITEDAETGFRLHSHGYRSVYINRPMVCGLSPESYDDYVIQRTRWAQGMVQILLLSNPLFERGLTLAQRLSYFNSCLFWFFGVARIIYYLAPAGFLIFGMAIYYASWPQILAYALPYAFSTTLLMHYFYSLSRRPLVSEIYETLQSIFLLPAVLSTFLHPRKPIFKVTPKGTFLKNEFLNPLALLLYLLISVNLLAFVLGIARWFHFPEYRDVISVTVAWCSYNIFIGVTALGAFWERKQIRRQPRIAASGEAEVYIPRLKQSVTVKLVDKSLEGASFLIQSTFAIKDREDIVITARDTHGASFRLDAVIMRSKLVSEEYFCGAQFRVTAEAFPQAVGFVFGDSQNWLDIWESPNRMGGTFALASHLFSKGVKGCILCFPMLVGSFVKFARERLLPLVKAEQSS